MTELKNTFSIGKKGQFKVPLTDEGRQVYFEKDCMDEVTVLRRINSGRWTEIGKDVRTPFFDPEKIPEPAEIEYKVIFKNGENNHEVVKVHLP
jgi:hypothetical protein